MNWRSTAGENGYHLVHLQDEHAAARHFHADIRQEDTLREPQHLDESNELKRFDRVVANPPFSQNYIKKDLKFSGRFP